MKNRILLLSVIFLSIYSILYGLTADEKEAINFFKDKLKGGVYHIEDYEKEKGLSISNESIIKDDDLIYLNKLKELDVLIIYNKSITDSGIQYIKNLKKLTILTINEAQLTDRGMEYIGQLENLEELNISDTQVTDEGLKHLRNLKKLEELVLDNTNITGEGFQYINELPNLRVLVVSPKLKGENLRYLGKMKLELLNIAENAIDDRAIPYLTKLKTLERLIIFDTKISKEGVKQLEKALPQCMVYDERGGGEDG
jgi:Leucine-rich repeat (LRR) protein